MTLPQANTERLDRSRDNVAELVIQTLAASEAELRDHNASILADVRMYREMLSITLGSVTRLTAQLANARREIVRLRAIEARATVRDRQPLAPCVSPSRAPLDIATVQ